MKRQFWKAAMTAFIICLLVTLCTGCKNDSSIKEDQPIPEPETLPTEQALLNAVINRVSDSSYVPEAEQEFMAEYHAYFNENTGADPSELLMDTYASYSEIQVKLLDNNTALVHMDVPDLSEILMNAISSLSDGERTAGNASELIQTAAQEILASGEFSRKASDVTVSYTLSENGTPKIVESQEYLDALYGGILSTTTTLFSQAQAEIENMEVAE